MEVVIFFILFAVCLWVMKVQADGHYCDGTNGDSYPLKFSRLEIYVNDDNSYRSVIHVIPPKDLHILDGAVNHHQTDYTDGFDGFRAFHESPLYFELIFPDLNSEAEDETLKIQHTQQFFGQPGQSPTNATLQITKPGKLVTEKPLLCISFTFDVPSDDLISME